VLITIFNFFNLNPKFMKCFFAIIFMYGSIVYAQDTEFTGTINWSVLFDVNKKTLAPDIIGQDGSSIYLSRFIKGDRHIEKYSLANLSLISSVEIELEYNEKELMLINQFMYGGSPTLLTAFYNKKTKKSYLFLQTIDPSTLAISAPLKIAEVQNMVQNGMGLSLYGALGGNVGMIGLLQSGANFYSSESQEFGFVMCPNITDATSEDDIKIGNYDFKATLYNDQKEVIAESDFKLPFANSVIISTKVSNEGDVFMLGYDQVKDEDSKKTLFGYQKMKMSSIKLLVLDVTKGDIELLDIEVAGRNIEMLRFELTEKGGVDVGGLLSAEGTGVNGSFLIKFDEGMSETSSKVADFESDFITTSWSEKKKEDLDKKKDKGKKVDEPELYNYYIDHFITKEDGSTLLLAEQYYVRVVTTTSTTANGGTTTTTTYYYYYNDIIAINYDASGELMWKTIIKKKQMSRNDGGYYSSYFTVVEGNDVHIIYNDSEANYVDTDGMSSSEIKAMKRSTIGAKVTLNADGSQSKQKLFEFEEGGLKLVPKICEEANDGIVFLYARSIKGDKIGTIDFN